jgi:hypothetical protein
MRETWFLTVFAVGCALFGAPVRAGVFPGGVGPFEAVEAVGGVGAVGAVGVVGVVGQALGDPPRSAGRSYG